eukprot:1158688-Pelagomonas_calceolata.AAC.9
MSSSGFAQFPGTVDHRCMQRAGPWSVGVYNYGFEQFPARIGSSLTHNYSHTTESRVLPETCMHAFPNTGKHWNTFLLDTATHTH